MEYAEAYCKWINVFCSPCCYRNDLCYDHAFYLLNESKGFSLYVHGTSWQTKHGKAYLFGGTWSGLCHKTYVSLLGTETKKWFQSDGRHDGAVHAPSGTYGWLVTSSLTTEYHVGLKYHLKSRSKASTSFYIQGFVHPTIFMFDWIATSFV